MRRIIPWLGLLTVALAALLVPRSMGQPSSRWVAQTGYAVHPAFLRAWQRAGVEQFGYPISEPFPEQNGDDTQTYTVQYFERVRLEYHPDSPTPIQLGRLGAELLVQGAPNGGAVPPATGVVAEALHGLTTSECSFFVETGQSLCGAFARAWHSAGGVARFGYPLAPPGILVTPDERLQVVQYTERARFEFDPWSGQISLGLLGRERYVPPPAAPARPLLSDPAVEALLAQINDVRTQVGLPPLTIAAELMAAAQAHSIDMATSGQISHTGSDGRGAPQRMRDAGYQWQRCGENIAVAFATAAQVLAFWMNSAPHRANLLDPGMHEIGIGYVAQEAGYGHYWTVALGTR